MLSAPFPNAFVAPAFNGAMLLSLPAKAEETPTRVRFADAESGTDRHKQVGERGKDLVETALSTGDDRHAFARAPDNFVANGDRKASIEEPFVVGPRSMKLIEYISYRCVDLWHFVRFDDFVNVRPDAGRTPPLQVNDGEGV